MPSTHSSLADVAAAYRTLIAHETEPKEQDFYRTRLQRLEPTTEPECEFDCRSRVAAAGVGVYCPQCSAECADTDLATQLAKAIRAAWVDRLDWDELAQGALEFLSSTGRLVPAGGMALTAEQVEDVRIVLGLNGSQDIKVVLDAQARLRALFPATEPAEEETKAEYPHRGLGDLTVLGPEIFTNGEVINWRGENFMRQQDPASSPVVPAPTETGPWQTVDAIPESVTRIEDCEGDVWHRCTAGWEHGGLHGPEGYAPFVAAKER